MSQNFMSSGPAVAGASTCRRSGSCRRGFTLIELLVVIAIIGILAAILFPVFAKAKAAGQRTACASNLKQLGQAFALYINDNAGRYPGGGNWQRWGDGGHWVKGVNGTPPTGDGSPGALADLAANAKGDFPYRPGTKADVQGGALFQYTRNAEIYKCPSNRDGDDKNLTYSMNCALAGATTQRVRNQTMMVLLVDEWRASDAYFWANPSTTSTDAATKDHLSANLLFMDGHVKAYTNDAFALDATTQGLANKSAGMMAPPGNAQFPIPKDDQPRFHEISLGPKGSMYPQLFGDLTKTFDSCAQETK